ncbi:uncharacterized protein K452DRAFT_312695 [Aplosporella prunicola CBS 121167]|uniref:HORMA domain-containing protein n=1 Tax=Aplosporella prunicola CBS 121167 TaxID=1176127 RepID=A0A6A6AZC2_9PEZI|nr:uncharacterized protein K452DRAFT_312695 [Aplosporella prunicola CBS 121167]KAF2136996.1 hypothetical protein K452DRAFT_312695 [Aplosporella prunicola CBS 121167]
MSSATAMRLRPRSGAPPELPATATRATRTASVAAKNKTAEKASAAKELQPIELDQSTDIAQTLIHSSISNVLFCREIFAESCYEHQQYNRDDPQWTYDDYIAGHDPTNSSGLQRGAVMCILKRGRNKTVNKLMDWLVWTPSVATSVADIVISLGGRAEKGAFDALKHRYLRAVQIQIYEDPDKAYEVIETYTFTVKYVDLPEYGGKAVAGLQFESPGGQVEEPLEQTGSLASQILTTRRAKHNLEKFIRLLSRFCGTLPHLPEQRRLRMYLFYTDDTPDDYHPPGFVKGQGPNIWFPEGDGWERHTHKLHEADLGHHNINLTISYIDRREGVREEIPSDLPYVRGTTRGGEIDEDMVDSSSTTKQLSQDPKITVPEQASKTVVPSTPPVSTQVYNQEMDVDLDEISDSFDAAQARSRDLPHDRDPEDIDGRQIAINNSNRGADNEESQQSLIILRSMPQNSPPSQELVETQPEDSAVFDRDSPAPDGRNQLSQMKVEELNRKKRSDFQTSVTRHHFSSQSQDDIISCQCGCNIHCGYCNTWQHLHCYGYLSSGNVAEPYACYRCILEEKEPEKIPKLQRLAMLRRGIHVLQMNGYRKDEEFRKELGCDIQTASGLVKCLKAEGFLLALPGYKRKGFSQNFPGKRPFQIVDQKSKVSEMRAKYFDPLLHIRHHYRKAHSLLQFVLPKHSIPSVPEDTSIQLPPPPHTQASHVQPESRRYTRLSLPHRPNTDYGIDMFSPTPGQGSMQRARTMTTTDYTPQSEEGVSLATPSRKRRNWPELVGTRVTPPRAAKKRKLFDMSEVSLDGTFPESIS